MKELVKALIIAAFVTLIVISSSLYVSYENRQAYYKCLEVTEKVANMDNPSEGVRIVSLPYCRL